jgi:hypothetical protein
MPERHADRLKTTLLHATTQSLLNLLACLSSSSTTLSRCTSSYPGGGSDGGWKFAACGLAIGLDLCGLVGCGAATTEPVMPAPLGLRLSSGGLGSASGTLACCPVSSYAGRSSRCKLFMLTPPSPLSAPLSRATSTACRNRSLSRSNVLAKSNAPPSLNSMTISSSEYCGGMPPPDTGCMRASHLFAPNHGAVTRESATLRMGTAKDCRVGVGVTGR